MVTETVEQNFEQNIEAGQATESGQATDEQVLAFERRRAGRQDISPVLVPLLRDPATGAAGLKTAVGHETAYRDYLDADPLAPARGIAVGLSLSMLFWGALGYIIFR
jgi:hypothetical protein